MDTEFSQLVRRYLKRRGLRRDELVRAMGLQHMSRGQKQLSRWLRGTAVPSCVEAQSLADALRIPIRYIQDALAADGEDHRTPDGWGAEPDQRHILSLDLGRGIDWAVQLPEGLKTNQALLLARARAKSIGAVAHLKTRGGPTYRIDAQGQIVGEIGHGPMNTD